jgi:DHA2 family multidrug resistance protein
MEKTSLSSFEKWMITITVMLVAVIEVLDITIVNVSLPQMMGTFSATTDEITWVLTSYVVSSAIFMPLTGILVRRLGRRRLLLLNIVGFLIASMLCGAATNLAEIVGFRILQGAFGAALVPLSQYILRDTFSREEQGKAMALWGMGIMVGPILGPTLGGYITELLNWRWVFYINVPVCILAFVMALSFVKETPRTSESIDWVGLLWMAIGIGSLQMVLDQGNSKNWLDSDFILISTLICVMSLSIFLYRGWNKKNNIVNLELFKERHFALTTALLTAYVMALFGTFVLQPIMMGVLLHYPADLTGKLMAPRGVASICSMILVSRVLMQRFDFRILVFSGMWITALGTYLMTRFNIYGDPWVYTFPGIIQGFGMGFVFAPLSSFAFDYLDKKHTAEAAGLYSFGRSMGISMGIAVLTTIFTQKTQLFWHHLSAYIRPDNPNLMHWVMAQQSTLPNLGNMHNWANLQHDAVVSPLALQMLAEQVQAQAMMNGFNNTFLAASIILVVISPLVLWLKKARRKEDFA